MMLSATDRRVFCESAVVQPYLPKSRQAIFSRGAARARPGRFNVRIIERLTKTRRRPPIQFRERLRMPGLLAIRGLLRPGRARAGDALPRWLSHFGRDQPRPGLSIPESMNIHRRLHWTQGGLQVALSRLLL